MCCYKWPSSKESWKSTDKLLVSPGYVPILLKLRWIIFVNTIPSSSTTTTTSSSNTTVIIIILLVIVGIGTLLMPFISKTAPTRTTTFSTSATNTLMVLW